MKLLFSYILILLGLSSCFQQEQTPDKLMIGFYKFTNSEGINLLNDSVSVMCIKINGIKHYDTLRFKYYPPIKDEGVVSVGDVIFRTTINQNSELYKYCKAMNCDETHLYYTLRNGQYILLPNPESTELCYKFLKY